jgi:cob(I)alamin adenosyltransferase
MKKSNLYTATGDKGTTSLVGGKRVSKCDARLEAYGTTDELNAHIGLLVAMMPAGDDVALLRRIQDSLFIVGSALATDLATTTLHEASRLKEEEITCVEQRIDYLDSQVPPCANLCFPVVLQPLHKPTCAAQCAVVPSVASVHWPSNTK